MSFTIPKPGVDPSKRAELQQVKQSLSQLRAQLPEAERALKAAKDAFSRRGDLGAGTKVTETKEFQDAQRAQQEVKSLQEQLAYYQDAESQLVGQMGDAVAARGGRPGIGAGVDLDPTAALSEQFSDPDFLEQMRRISSSSGNFGDVSIGQIPRDALTRLTGGALQSAATGGIVTPTPDMLLGPYGGVTPYPTPATSFLDVVPSDTIDYPSLPYSQEIPETGDPGPAPAAPGSLKAAAGVGYVDTTTATTTVAGWVKVNRQNLADVGQLQGAIQNRLLIKLRQQLEAEVLAGDGTVSDVANVPGIKGILNTSGIGSVDATGLLTPDAALDGIVNLLTSGAQPNAIVLNVNDWANVLKTKTGADNAYVSSPFLATARQLWNLSFLPSVAVAQGTAIVIDTTRCMTLLFREAANVRLGLDQDDFTRNKVTLLVECRAMLPIWVPGAACEVTNIA